jgi:hypothetical protein
MRQILEQVARFGRLELVDLAALLSDDAMQRLDRGEGRLAVRALGAEIRQRQLEQVERLGGFDPGIRGPALLRLGRAHRRGHRRRGRGQPTRRTAHGAIAARAALAQLVHHRGIGDVGHSRHFRL